MECHTISTQKTQQTIASHLANIWTDKCILSISLNLFRSTTNELCHWTLYYSALSLESGKNKFSEISAILFTLVHMNANHFMFIMVIFVAILYVIEIVMIWINEHTSLEI